MFNKIKLQLSFLFGKNRLKNEMSRYIFSFWVIILICTFVMTAIIYLYVDKITERNITDANNSTLLNFRNTTDSFILKNINAMGLSILSGDDIFVDLFDKPIGENYGTVTNIYNRLKSMENLNPIINEISIYYKNNDVLISTKGIIYLKNHSSKPDERDTEWITHLDSMKKISEWIGPRITSGKENIKSNPTNTITLLFKYPFSFNNSLGGVAISIDESKLHQLIKNTASENIQQIIIVNEKGIIISHNNENYISTTIYDLPYGKKLENLKNDSGYFVTREGGKKVIVSYASSAYNNWKYVTVNYTDQLAERYKFIYLMLLYFGVCLIITCLFVLFISMKRICKANSKVNDLSSIITEQENEIQKNRNIVRQNFYLNLINGIYQREDEITNQFQLLKIDFSYPLYIVSIIKLYGEKASDLRTFEYTKLKAMEFAKAAFQEAGINCLCTQSKKDIILILNLKDNSTDYKEIIRKICEHIYNELGFKTCAGLGNIFDNLLGITISYMQAISCINYSYLLSDKLLLTYDEIIPMETSKDIIPDTYIERFSNNLRLYNKKEAILCIHDLIADISQNTYSYSHVQSVLNHIISSLEKFKKQMSKETAANTYPDLFYSFGCCESIIDFTVLVENVLDSWIDSSESYSKTRNRELVEKAKLYINLNLKHECISLNSIANIMHISHNYLSRIFKEETAMYFIDYLTEARLEMSKDLLMCSDMQIENIAEIAGYSSQLYYNRKFKARYGVTPKQYRQANTININNDQL